MNTQTQESFEDENSEGVPLYDVDTQFNEAQRDVNDHVDATEVVAECHAGLEAVAAALEAHVNDLDPSAATWLWASFESHTTRLGLTNDLPSLEGLKSPRLAEPTIKLSMETVGEAVKKAWAMLVDMFRRAWNAVLTFFGKVKTNQQQVITRAQTVDRALNTDGKGWPAEPEVLLDQALAARLAIDTTVDLSSGSISSTLKRLESLSLRAWSRQYEIAQAVEKICKDPNDTRIWDALLSDLAQSNRMLSEIFRGEGVNHVVHSDIMPGNRYIAANIVRGENMDSVHSSVKKMLLQVEAMEKTKPQLTHDTTKEVSNRVGRPTLAEVRHSLKLIIDSAKSRQRIFQIADTSKVLQQMELAERKNEVFTGDQRRAVQGLIRVYSSMVHLAVQVEAYLARTYMAYIDALARCDKP